MPKGMAYVNEFLLSGLVFGFAAGISPGPLMAMTISESLKYGSREGVKVAVSPFITDILIVLTILFLLINLESHSMSIAIISFAGALYLLYLGVESILTGNLDIEIDTKKSGSLKKGIIVNFLSPHPYLFWITIGGPILFRALEIDIASSILFIAGFYSLLVGSKIVIAIFVGRFRSFLKSNYYLYTIRALGMVYIIFAVFFLRQGFKML